MFLPTFLLWDLHFLRLPLFSPFSGIPCQVCAILIETTNIYINIHINHVIITFLFKKSLLFFLGLLVKIQRENPFYCTSLCIATSKTSDEVVSHLSSLHQFLVLSHRPVC